MKKLSVFAALLIAFALTLTMVACTGGNNESSSVADSSVAEGASSADSADDSEEESSADSGSLEDSEDESEVTSESSDAEGSASFEESGDDEPTAATPLLYKATGKNGGTVYLFGTIHVADERVEELPGYVMSAYNESDWLCVEVDMAEFNADAEAQMATLQKMQCDVQKGETVKNFISEELYADMKELLEGKGLYNQLFDYYKPYFWYTLVQQAYLSDTGLNSENGIDMKLLNLAHDSNKEIREAESVEFQYDMLLGFDNDVYRMMLESVIYDYQTAVDETVKLYNMWLSGDEEEFALMLAEEGDIEGLIGEELALYESYEKALITDRNIAMAELVEDYLAEGGTGFFAVGAAHIVGEGAVVELLRAEGYTVELVAAE